MPWPAGHAAAVRPNAQLNMWPESDGRRPARVDTVLLAVISWALTVQRHHVDRAAEQWRLTRAVPDCAPTAASSSAGRSQGMWCGRSSDYSDSDLQSPLALTQAHLGAQPASDKITRTPCSDSFSPILRFPVRVVVQLAQEKAGIGEEERVRECHGTLPILSFFHRAVSS